ncbi:hypothetical protein DAI22_02g119100 [Oryza sativa Japonica Group]|nr:hypothetical protein DAI22_02g119100 [Oryza sativa Japonica Group]
MVRGGTRGWAVTVVLGKAPADRRGGGGEADVRRPWPGSEASLRQRRARGGGVDGRRTAAAMPNHRTPWAPPLPRFRRATVPEASVRREGDSGADGREGDGGDSGRRTAALTGGRGTTATGGGGRPRRHTAVALATSSRAGRLACDRPRHGRCPELPRAGLSLPSPPPVSARAETTPPPSFLLLSTATSSSLIATPSSPMPASPFHCRRPFPPEPRRRRRRELSSPLHSRQLLSHRCLSLALPLGRRPRPWPPRAGRAPPLPTFLGSQPEKKVGRKRKKEGRRERKIKKIPCHRPRGVRGFGPG